MQNRVNEVLVRQAYNELKTRGEYPSAQKIRNHLGAGSLGTIHPLLQKIRNEERDVFGELGQVSQKLAETVLVLHGQLKNYSEGIVADAQAQFDEQLALAEAERSAMESKFKLSQAALAAAQEELQLARSMYEREREGHAATREQNAALVGRLEQATEQIDALTVRARNAERNEKQARDQEHHAGQQNALMLANLKQSHDETISKMHKETQRLNSALANLSSELAEEKVHRSNADGEVTQLTGTLADLRAVGQRLAEQVEGKELRVIELVSALEKAHERERGLSSNVLVLQGQFAECQQTLAIAEVKLTAAAADIGRLTTEAQELRNQLAAKAEGAGQ